MVLGFLDKSIGLEVELEEPPRLYRPGDAVRATITLSPQKDVKVREVLVGLVSLQEYEVVEEYRDSDGEYRDRRVWRKYDDWFHKATLIREGTISGGENRTFTYKCQMPAEAAPTYSGSIIRNRWVVKAVVDRAMAKDVNSEVGLEVLTSAKPRKSGDQRMIRGAEVAHLEIITSKSEVADGRAIDGSLIVRPRVDFDAREVRIELVRVEEASTGERNNLSEAVAYQVRLASRVALSRLRDNVYDFRIPVALEGKPSFRMTGATVTWGLRATVDRPLATDAQVWQELYLYQGENRVRRVKWTR